MFKNKYLHILWASVTLAPAATAGAQAYPTKPIRLVIPFSTGAASDFLGRTVGQKLGERYAQQVVNDNRPHVGAEYDRTTHSDDQKRLRVLP